ncbi:MAG TPA: hypothetical protein VFM18_17095 [Methanosarcina sp.]|nr:hypothetical protein [Methanosarcina sp.]
MKYQYHPDGGKPPVDDQWIFVFGSNLAGKHGGGAAREALETYGAVYGKGLGRHGKSYALPTKGFQIETLKLSVIEGYVRTVFLPYARANQDLKFYVTRVGCVLAGYTNEDIAPLFKDAPTNCVFPEPWMAFLEDA